MTHRANRIKKAIEDQLPNPGQRCDVFIVDKRKGGYRFKAIIRSKKLTERDFTAIARELKSLELFATYRSPKGMAEMDATIIIEVFVPVVNK